MNNQILKEKILEHFFKAEDDYEIIEIGNYAIINTGNSIPAEIKEKKYSNLLEGYNYIGTKDVNVDNTIVYENGIKIPFDEGFKVAKKNDILLCIEGGSAGKKLGFLNEDVCFGNKLCRFSVDTKVINSKYLFYYMQSKYFIEEFNSRITGIIGGVSTSRIKKIKIAIPNISKQEEIADKVSEIFNLIQQKEKNDKEIEKIKEDLKNQILDEAIHGKLVNNDKKLKPIEVEEIKDKPFEIPENWKWSNFGKMADKISDGTHSTPKYVEEGVPFLSVKDMSKGKISFDSCKYITKEEHDLLYSRCDPKYGDVLITKVGTTGVPVVVETTEEFSLFVSVAQLRFDNTRFYNYYIKNVVNSKFVQNIIDDNTRGAANKNWVIKDIMKTPIPVPPIEEQKKIVKKIDSIFELIDKME